jgi:alkylhydroperoxidase family enzyme
VPWLAQSPQRRDAGSELDALIASGSLVGEEWLRYSDLVLEQAPAELAELLRLRLAQIHDCDPAADRRLAELPAEQVEALADWEESHAFSAVQRRALAVADKWAWRVHDITDEDVACLSAELGPGKTVALLTALSLFDVHCRLQVIFELDESKEDSGVD